MLVSTVTASTIGGEKPGLLGDPPRCLNRRTHHRGTTGRVDREHADSQPSDGSGSTLNLMRDVVELQIQEYVKAQLLQLRDDCGTFRVEQRHADLDPANAASERRSQS